MSERTGDAQLSESRMAPDSAVDSSRAEFEIGRSAPATRIRWLIVIMLMGFTLQGHFNRVSISVPGNEQWIRPGGMSEVQMGRVYSAFLLIYTLSMLPGGWLIDRIGPRLALTGMGLGMGSCVIITGLLGWSGLSVASMFAPLLLIRGAAGAFSVPLHPGAARSISLWLPANGRSAGNGLVTAGALLGISFTYPGFGMLMDRLGWASAFVLCGTVLIAFSLIWLLFSADGPHQHPHTNAAERKLIDNGRVLQVRQSSSLDDFIRLFLNRGLLLLTGSYAAVSYFQYLFFYWIGHYFEKVLELPTSESRRATFYVTLAMAGGMAFGGYLSDGLSHLLGRRRSYRVVAMGGMCLSAGFAGLGVNAVSPLQIVVLFALALAALGMCEGIFWTCAPAFVPKNGGLACAFLNTVGNAGGLLAPMLTPWIGQQFGWPTAIAVACVVCLAGDFMWLGIYPDEVESPPPVADEPSLIV